MVSLARLEANVDALSPLQSREASARVFLILQGPPSGFFKELAREIDRQGAQAIKVNLHSGDWFYSLGMNTVNYRGSSAEWPSWIREFARARKVTDLVVYGDCREYHKVAISILKPLGIVVHVLEEGYVRPAWITYERNGVNGYSRLADMSLADLDREKIANADVDTARNLKGTMWSYILNGIAYYAASYWIRPAFPYYRSHRPQGVLEEAWTWLKRIPALPKARVDAKLRGARIARGRTPYFLVLLQLGGDSQMRSHSGFRSVSEFIDLCIRSFAASAGGDEKLVFKSHPLDPNALDLKQEIKRIACHYGVDERCSLIDGGKLAYLTDNARGVIAINSTACQVSIRRGIPTKVLGRAIYNHRPLAASGSLEEFFSDPQQPDVEAYELFHRFLLLTVQINGSFYSKEGIRMAVPVLVDKMMAPHDPILPFVSTTPVEVTGTASAGAAGS